MSLFNCALTGFAFSNYRTRELHFLNESNSLGTPFYQMLELRLAFKGVSSAFQAGGSKPLTSRALFFYAPYLLTALQSSKIENDSLRNSAHFVQNYFGAACQVAAIVSSIAMIYFGAVSYGVISLGMIALGELERGHYLPVEVEKSIETARPYLKVVRSVLYGSALSRYFTFSKYTVLFYDTYFATTEIPKVNYRPIKFTLEQNLPFGKIERGKHLHTRLFEYLLRI